MHFGFSCEPPHVLLHLVTPPPPPKSAPTFGRFWLAIHLVIVNPAKHSNLRLKKRTNSFCVSTSSQKADLLLLHDDIDDDEVRTVLQIAIAKVDPPSCLHASLSNLMYIVCRHHPRTGRSLCSFACSGQPASTSVPSAPVGKVGWDYVCVYAAAGALFSTHVGPPPLFNFLQSHVLDRSGYYGYLC